MRVTTYRQSKVPPNLQGRVFALRKVVSLSSAPLGALLAGPLADYFQNLLEDVTSTGRVASMGIILEDGYVIFGFSRKRLCNTIAGTGRVRD